MGGAILKIVALPLALLCHCLHVQHHTSSYPLLSPLRNTLGIDPSILFKNLLFCQALVMHTFNPCYLEGQGQEDHDLRPANSSQAFLLQNN
jgi:hypothetical protein